MENSPTESLPLSNLDHIRQILSNPEQLKENLPQIKHLIESGNFEQILEDITSLISNTSPGVAGSSLEILRQYIKGPLEHDLVVQSLIETGLSSTEWRARHQTLRSLNLLFQQPLSSKEIQYKLYEAVQSLQEDEHELVRQTAEEILCSLPPPIPIPADLLRRLEDKNWRARVTAASELESLMPSLKNLSGPETENLTDLVIKLLADENFKVALSALNLVENLLEIKGVNKEKLLFGCLEPLGSDKVAVRQTAFKVFKDSLFKIPTLKFVRVLISNLQHPNWHIREELVNVCIAAMLTENYIEDYSELVAELAKLLDDSKNKVKYVAVEALTVCAKTKGRTEIEEILSPIIDENVMKSLVERFKSDTLPVVKETTIEFPRSVPSSAPIFSSPSVAKMKKAPRPPVAPGPRRETQKVPSEPIRRYQSADPEQSPRTLSPLKAEEPLTYLDREDLSPVFDTASTVDSILQEEQNNWEKEFEIINQIRRILKHSPKTFEENPGLVGKIVGLACSFRSSVAKNALIAISELFELGSAIESDLSTLAGTLLKRVTDANQFISEAAREALASMCENIQPGKVSSVLLALTASSKNENIKVESANCYSLIFERRKRIGQITKMVEILGAYIEDASSNVRLAAREAFKVLKDSFPDYESILYKALSEQSIKKIKTVLEREADISMLRSYEAHSSYGRSRKPYVRNRSAETRKELPDIDNVQELSIKIQSSDWKLRCQTLEELVEYLEANRSSISRTSKVIPLIDILCKALGDENTKVIGSALRSTLKVVPILNKNLQPYLGSLYDSLLGSIGSSNGAIREITFEVCEKITEFCDPCIILPGLVSVFEKANRRAKSRILQFLLPLIGPVENRKPGLITKHIVPLISRLLENPGREFEEEIAQVVKNLYNAGCYLLEIEEPEIINKILEIINTEI